MSPHGLTIPAYQSSVLGTSSFFRRPDTLQSWPYILGLQTDAHQLLPATSTPVCISDSISSTVDGVESQMLYLVLTLLSCLQKGHPNT